MGNELLRALLRNKNITICDIKSFYDLNLEQLVELLLNYLRIELASIEHNQLKDCPKYLFRVLQKIEYLYGCILDEDKSILPFYRDYMELREKLFTISKIKKIEGESTFIEDEWYLKLYYYKDINYVKKMMKEDRIIELLETNNKILYDMLTEYIHQLLNDDYYEYHYWRDVINYFLLETDNDQLIEISVQCLKKYIDKHSKKFPINYKYRLNDLLNICYKVKQKYFTEFEQYKINFLEEKTLKENVEVFTIDEEETHLREDALSIYEEDGIFHVTMYITDPTDLFSVNPGLEDEAFSNWFIHQRDYIFDHSFSKQNFSLDKDTEHDVIAYELQFEGSGKLKQVDIYPTRVSIDTNYSYDKVSEILINNRKSKETDKFIILYGIAKALQESNTSKKKYHKMKQLHYYLKNSKRYKPNQKYLIISELKILIGTIMASVFQEQQIPVIYRNNKSKLTNFDIEQIEQTCNEFDQKLSVIDKIDALNLTSYYSYQNDGHNGIGVSQYVHITTPLRNYFALINMMILKDILIYNKIEEIPMYQEKVITLTELQYEKQHYRKKVHQLKKIHLKH